MMKAGLYLVAAMLHNSLGTEEDFRQVLELAAQASRLVAENAVLTRQFEIAAACQATVAHIGLAGCVSDEAERQSHREQALQMSQAALDGYQSLGFVQIIECVSEEIFFRHSQALTANGREEEAAEFRQRACDEMTRKHDLIPADMPFRQTYLENIPLHRDIRSAGLQPVP
jgi:GAF domain-containing protein